MSHCEHRADYVLNDEVTADEHERVCEPRGLSPKPDPAGEPFTTPCEFCTGNSSCYTGTGEDRRPLTSEELCRELGVCTATVDWEVVFNGT